MKIKILGRIAFAVLPSPLENPDDWAVSIAEVRDGLLVFLVLIAPRFKSFG